MLWMIFMAEDIGRQKAMPSASSRTAVLIPMTCPNSFTIGPPEFPGLIAASICIIPRRLLPLIPACPPTPLRNTNTLPHSLSLSLSLSLTHTHTRTGTKRTKYFMLLLLGILIYYMVHDVKPYLLRQANDKEMKLLQTLEIPPTPEGFPLQ